MKEEIRKNLIRKKTFLLACMYMFFSVYVNHSLSNRNRNLSYNINSEYSDGECFGTCNGYNIYFGNEEDLQKYLDNKNNICVIDSSRGINPNYKICESYRITSEEEMYNIIGVIMEYDKLYPSNWHRSVDGLQIEWYLHNVCYEMNIFVDRSESVDLDMRDYFIFEDKLLKLVMGK
jgi:hypothetical protein